MQCCNRRSSLRGRVCVVYGALPPEMRRMQARLFNKPGNGYDVLVASDAIGMGLNLNIRRVIFHTLSKTMGGGQEDAIEVPPSQIKQIAGAPPSALPPNSCSCCVACLHSTVHCVSFNHTADAARLVFVLCCTSLAAPAAAQHMLFWHSFTMVANSLCCLTEWQRGLVRHVTQGSDLDMGLVTHVHAQAPRSCAARWTCPCLRSSRSIHLRHWRRACGRACGAALQRL